MDSDSDMSQASFWVLLARNFHTPVKDLSLAVNIWKAMRRRERRQCTLERKWRGIEEVLSWLLSMTLGHLKELIGVHTKVLGWSCDSVLTHLHSCSLNFLLLIRNQLFKQCRKCAIVVRFCIEGTWWIDLSSTNSCWLPHAHMRSRGRVFATSVCLFVCPPASSRTYLT